MEILSINNITKTFNQVKSEQGFMGVLKSLFNPQYTTVKALDNISFDLERGKKVALLGRNGAGKSTLVKILVGALTATSGNITLDGVSIALNSTEYKKKLGVIFGQRCQLWWDLPVIDSLKALKVIYEVSDEIFDESIKLFDDVAGLKNLLGVAVKNLSLGQRTLCELLATCLHRPEILILDEPTIGLDVEIKEAVRNLINLLNDKFKTTILLTSHDTDDIENICDHIVLINGGSVIFNDHINNFYKTHGLFCTIQVSTKNAISAKEISLIINREETKTEKIEVNKSDTRKCTITFDKSKIEPFDLVDRIKCDLDLTEIQIHNASLENAIKYAYKNI